jgi:gliding motility-associated-like protein
MDNGFLIFVPNTFTPNGDERNNTFQPIIPVPVSSFNMKIYNRWGEIVFESYDPSASWDGYYNGHLVQDGTYIWEIVAVTDKANTYIRKGHLNVLK